MRDIRQIELVPGESIDVTELAAACQPGDQLKLVCERISYRSGADNKAIPVVNLIYQHTGER